MQVGQRARRGTAPWAGGQTAPGAARKGGRPCAGLAGWLADTLKGWDGWISAGGWWQMLARSGDKRMGGSRSAWAVEGMSGRGPPWA